MTRLGSGDKLLLSDLTEYMHADQLRAVAATVNPDAKAKNTAEAKKAIAAALKDEVLLRGALSRLSDLDLFLLNRLRSAGGSAGGWDLILEAAAAGFEPPKFAQAPLYGRMPLDRPGPRFLLPLLQGGLLLPASNVNPWVTDSFYSSVLQGADIVTADERVLAALPNRPKREAPPLDVPAQGVPTAGRTPMQVLAELWEAYRVVTEAGGVALTQAGRPNRSGVSRLAKRSGLLRASLDLDLLILAFAGWLTVDERASELRPNLQVRPLLERMSPPERLASLVQGYLNLPGDAESEGQLLAQPLAARRALLTGLALLPGPAEKEAALTAMHARLFQFVTHERWYTVGGRNSGLPPLPSWYGSALSENGLPARLGLVSLGEFTDGQKKKLAVAPGPTLAYLREPPQPAPGPAWLVQPNFEVLAYLDRLTGDALNVLFAARCERADAQTATYKLTRESVYGALENGLGADELLDGLARFSATPLTNALRSTILDWAARRERLTVYENATLLEYEDAGARDAGAAKTGGRAVGDRYLLLPAGEKLPRGAAKVAYDAPPKRTLHFDPDGRFQVDPAGDLLARQVIETVSTLEQDGRRRLNPEGVAKVGPSVLGTLETRVAGTIPAPTRTLLSVWGGASPPPTLAEVALLQHPNARALGSVPQLRPFVQGILGPDTFLVRPGKLDELRAALRELNITPGEKLSVGGLSGAPAEVTGNVPLTHGLDTRRLRIMIEEAIEAGRDLDVLFRDERYNSYGERVPGRARRARLKPLRVDRSGSTPYLEARDLGADDDVTIRIGYVDGIAVL